MATTNGIARHHRDRDLGYTANQTLQIQDIQARHPLRVEIARCGPNTLITTGTKGILTIGVGASPRQQYHTNRGVITGIAKSRN